VRWGILSEMIIAASRGDRYVGHRATQRLASEVPDDGVAGTYLYYLIHHRVRELSGPRPSAEDLQRLALAIYPKFASAGRADLDLLERTLRTYFVPTDRTDEVAGGVLVIAGAVALGAMLDNPAVQLEEMRPYLAAWWRKHLDEHRARGLLNKIQR
jgi:hypothetical protein